MKSTPKTYTNPPIALPITSAELLAFGIPQSAIDAGEFRGDLKNVGPWQLPISYSALCTSTIWGEFSKRISETVYGIRTLSKPAQSGFCLEGKVSVNGKSVRGFTSSQLFELPCGKLVNVATIHACL